MQRNAFKLYLKNCVNPFLSASFHFTHTLTHTKRENVMHNFARRSPLACNLLFVWSQPFVIQSIAQMMMPCLPGHLIAPSLFLSSSPAYSFNVTQNTFVLISSKSFMLWDRQTSFYNKLRCSLPTSGSSISVLFGCAAATTTDYIVSHNHR